MKKKIAVTAPSHFASDAILRSLAITTVLGLHFLSSLKSTVYTTDSFHHWIIGLDQLGRFCIPLFVALSGYGLMQKYQKTPFNWPEFLQRRVFKLLPAYMIWSVALFVIFWFLPLWRGSGEPIPFWKQLLYGEADYHLYFVPMIFQLYLAFPFLMWFVKRMPWLSLAGAGLFQIALYSYYVERGDVFARGLKFVTDQQQYFWGFTWIFYFILGMTLPLIYAKLQRYKGWFIALVVVTLASWWWAATSAMTQIDTGTDPIVALRFTRWPLLLYGTTSVMTLTWLATRVTTIPAWLAHYAKKSYWIYLTHTIFLRILFTIL